MGLHETLAGIYVMGVKQVTGQTDTWTLGPAYPVASCRRCGFAMKAEDVASGWCPRCGDMGAVEFEEDNHPL